MSTILHGFYREDAPLEQLRLKGALLRQDPDYSDCFLAQFDDRSLPEAYGWHTLPKEHFIGVEGIASPKRKNK